MRVKSKDLESKIMDPTNAVRLFISKASSIGFGGMGGQSVPKAIPRAMAEVSEKENINFSLSIFTGGGGTQQFEDNLSKIDIPRRYYYLSSGNSREKINNGKTEFFDYWVGEYSRFLRDGYIMHGKKIDISVIEATGIDENGNIIPSLSVDAIPALIDASDKIIIEINESKPYLLGLHDIYLPELGKPINITNPLDKVGKPFIRVKESKIAAVVITSEKEVAGGSYSSLQDNDYVIAENIAKFLEKEVEKGMITEENPLQLGAGPIASAILDKLSIEHIRIWSEIIPAKWAKSLGSKVDAISASALYTLPGEERHLQYVFDNLEYVKKRIVLRPSELENNPEIILRLGAIAVQQAIEIDIFGSANVSHISGMIHNGVGGSGDFTRASKLVIAALPSTASNGKFSRIVPMLFNTDIPRQDIDIVVTEFGMADLRGLSPNERAREIIGICSHPKYKDLLLEYHKKAFSKGGHVPVDLEAVMEFNEKTRSL